MRCLATLGLAFIVGCQSPDFAGDSAGSVPGSDFEGAAFEFEEVMEGVYQARGTGNVAVGSNAAVIINDDDVLLVDSHISPAAASALLDELREITDKPVRYVVNTHFHFDHAHGNQIYPGEVEVIGHEFTREMLASGESVGRTYQGFQEMMSAQPGYAEGQQGLVPTPPTTTLSERMTLHRGGREIRLLFFGRGHTGGDIVVHLPQERALITGDLLLPGVPFMGDGFPMDWVETLEELKGLPVDVVIPGHGSPFSDLGRRSRGPASRAAALAAARAAAASSRLICPGAFRSAMGAHAGRNNPSSAVTTVTIVDGAVPSAASSDE